MARTPSCCFLDDDASFRVEHPDRVSYLYFPLVNEAPMMSAITPTLGGDVKTGQNTFLLEPAAAETLHASRAGRNFWVYSPETGAVSVVGASAAQRAVWFDDRAADEVSLEGGLFWQTVTRRLAAGLTAAVTSFVPAGHDAVELHRIVLRNDRSNPLTLKVYTAIPLYARSADNLRDHRHVTALLHRASLQENGVSVFPTLTFDERGHKRNTVGYGVFAADETGRFPVRGCLSVEDFIGEGGSFDNPRLIGQDLPLLAGATLDGYETVAALQFADLTLAPGASFSYVMALAIDGQDGDGSALSLPYLQPGAFEAALSATKAYWQRSLTVTVHTGDPTFDRFMKWVAVQPTLRRLYGCSFLPHHDYGHGGRGWRDLWQDCLALLMMNPDGVRQLLLSSFAGVRADGTNATIIGSAPGEFKADRNRITRVWMDHGAWPYLTVKLYLDRTGDWPFLLEKAPYFKDALICRAHERDTAWREEDGCRLLTRAGTVYEGTVLEHLLLQNLIAFYCVGEHHFLRLEDADWNDGLDMARHRGESVAFTCLYADNLASLAELLEKLQQRHGMETVKLAASLRLLFDNFRPADYESLAEKRATAQAYYATCTDRVDGRTESFSVTDIVGNLREKAAYLRRLVHDTQWVGDGKEHRWLNSYYDDNGRPVEGVVNGRVRMMLTGQVYAIMSGVTTEEETAAITRAADAYLYDSDCGGYRLNTDFGEIKTDLGRAFGFAFGHKENGAVFCHMTVMYANALYRRGFAREGFKALEALYRQSTDFSKARIYPGIPEYFDPRGRGLYHYLTGSASWFLLTLLNEVFGVAGDLGDLCITPRLLLSQFDESGIATVTAPFHGKTLRFVYCNPQRKDYGDYTVASLALDGKLLSSSPRIPAAVLDVLDENVHTVTVTLA